MKKQLAVLAVLIALLATTVGCQNTQKNDPETSGTDTEAVTETATEQESPVTDFTYEENQDGGITITEYIGSDSQIVVPAVIDGKPVTEIGTFAFALVCPTHVTLPDTIVSIGTQAFLQCKSLHAINMPKNLKTIGDEAFLKCENLSAVTLPDSLTHIGYQAFLGCTSLTHINIPSNCLNEHSVAAFRESGLETVEFAEGVEYIPDECFAYTNLKEIVLPNSVKVIERQAFFGCESLQKMTLNEGLTEIGMYAFYQAQIKEIVIPASVTYLSIQCFADCMNLSKVMFEGNAPTGYEPTEDGSPMNPNGVNYTIYYHEGAEGFTSPEWNGYPTETW